ncbi:glycosyltransferase family 39 protein [Streptomyces sp. NPDC087425]|uniref:glycosyltransferase family 39 protein n=1 Tax=Streptomyces sp. NPDC087425 TaxID=3365787 RepID=UPI00380E8A34
MRREGSLWRDEAVTYDMAHRTLGQLRATVVHVDLVHTVYYLLMHGLFDLFGAVHPLLVLRLPSVAAAAVATALVAALGRRLAGRRAGGLAGCLFAVVPQVQRFAQEGRSYALVTACVVGATYLLVRALRSGSRATWAGYAALMLTAALLHEFAILALTAHACAVPRLARRRWLVAAAVPVVGVAPLALLSTGQSAQVSWIDWDVTGLTWYAAAGTVAVLCARLLLRPVATASHDAAARLDGDARVIQLVRVALPLAILPGAILLLASLVQPLFVDRYLLYSTAGQALLVGAALARASRALLRRGRGPRSAVIAALVLAVLAVPTYSVPLRKPNGRGDDVTAIAGAVRRLKAPGEGVLYEPSRRRVWSLTSPASFSGLRDLALAQAPDRSGWLYGTEVPAAVLHARLLRERRVIVLRDPAGEPLDVTPAEVTKRLLLAEAFQECRTLYPHGARVSVYARGGHC